MSRECLNILRQENRALIAQLREMLQSVTATEYQSVREPFERGGVGKHVRHILDHYHAFLEPSGGVVDYESRERDTQLETDPSAASNACLSVLSRLADSEEVPAVSGVRQVLESESCAIGSSAVRELHFLSSHTTHHMALISFILRSLGASVPDNFGVAFSTLRYEARTGS